MSDNPTANITIEVDPSDVGDAIDVVRDDIQKAINEHATPGSRAEGSTPTAWYDDDTSPGELLDAVQSLLEALGDARNELGAISLSDDIKINVREED